MAWSDGVLLTAILLLALLAFRMRARRRLPRPERPLFTAGGLFGGTARLSDAATAPGGAGTSMDCPRCGRCNPPSAPKCDCGHYFLEPQRNLPGCARWNPPQLSAPTFGGRTQQPLTQIAPDKIPDANYIAEEWQQVVMTFRFWPAELNSGAACGGPPGGSSPAFRQAPAAVQPSREGTKTEAAGNVSDTRSPFRGYESIRIGRFATGKGWRKEFLLIRKTVFPNDVGPNFGAVSKPHGFRVFHCDSRAVYLDHPDGSRIEGCRDGTWIYRDPDGNESQGSGLDALNRHLWMQKS